MEKIYIVTDSTSGITQEIMDLHKVKVLPLTVELNGKVYKDMYEINEKMLLEGLTSGDELPKTSQINPKTFYDEYESLIREGYKIISIHISSGLSGTYQSACIARDMLEDEEDVFVIDSKSASFGTGALVMEAIKMVELDYDIEKIVNNLYELREKLKIGFALETLEYLKKGGRISSVQAAVGTLLNVKPVLHMKDGKVEILEKTRGKKKAIKSLFNYVLENKIDTSLTFGIGNVDGLKDMKELQSMFGVLDVDTNNIKTAEIGSVISTYTGPGTIGVFFFSK